jgi:hypothetical protein
LDGDLTLYFEILCNTSAESIDPHKHRFATDSWADLSSVRILRTHHDFQYIYMFWRPFIYLYSMDLVSMEIQMINGQHCPLECFSLRQSVPQNMAISALN